MTRTTQQAVGAYIRVLTVALILGSAYGCSGPEFTEIAPAIYLGAGNECGVLDDEFDGAVTTIVGGPGGRPALAVCARILDSGEWVVVDGVLGVENVVGEARVLLIPPDNASLFADAPASLEALAVGHVRVTAAFGDMTGSGVIEIVAE